MTDAVGMESGGLSRLASPTIRTFLLADIRGYTRFTAERGDSAGVGLDAGEAVQVGSDYRGNAINRAARLCSIGVGKRTLASRDHPDEKVVVEALLSWGRRGLHQWWLNNDNAFEAPGLRHLIVHGECIIPLLPMPIVANAGGAGVSEYTVQPGDTLWTIVRAHSISPNQLEEANPQIRDPNLIYVGEVISLYMP